LDIATWVKIDRLRLLINAPFASVVNLCGAVLTHLIQAFEVEKRRELLRVLAAIYLYDSVCTFLFEHLALDNCPLN
jgi:hypothetical protein